VRCGLVVLLAGEPGFRVAGAFGSMEEALSELERAPPAILLADVSLPGITGIEGVRRLCARHPGLLALMLTVHAESERVFEARLRRRLGLPPEGDAARSNRAAARERGSSSSSPCERTRQAHWVERVDAGRSVPGRRPATRPR